MLLQRLVVYCQNRIVHFFASLSERCASAVESSSRFITLVVIKAENQAARTWIFQNRTARLYFIYEMLRSISILLKIAPVTCMAAAPSV